MATAKKEPAKRTIVIERDDTVVGFPMTVLMSPSVEWRGIPAAASHFLPPASLPARRALLADKTKAGQPSQLPAFVILSVAATYAFGVSPAGGAGGAAGAKGEVWPAAAIAS